MRPFEWVDARTVEEALSALEPGAAAKAGGVDLLDLMKARIASPSRLVNLRNVASLGGVRVEGDALRIGPLATLAQVARDAAVRERAAALAEAAGLAATPQVRNMATLGGNLLQRPRCWYFRDERFRCRKKGGDRCFAIEGENRYHAVFGNGACAIVHPSSLATALVALGATVVVTGADGAREVAIEKVFVAPETDVTREHALRPGELLTEVRVPGGWTRSAYARLGERESAEWPIAEAAVALELDATGRVRRASVVLGAAAPVPRRAKAAEAALVGKRVDAATARAAAEAAVRGATPLSDNAYKVAALASVARRAILAAGGAR